MAKAKELFERAADDGRELGVDPSTGHVIIAKDGRYGPYVTEVLPEPEGTQEPQDEAAPKKRTSKAKTGPKPGRPPCSRAWACPR